MEPTRNIESDLERVGAAVSLRADEKEAHRDAVLAFMRKNPLPVRSPYAWLTGHGMRYAAALMLFFVIGGTSGTLAAEGARPGDILYPVKLTVTEPARSALTLDPEEKTAFELERADRRLKEFALVASSANPDPSLTALINDSLAGNIEEVSKDIGELAAAGEADEALAMNAELQSVLSAHSDVLDIIEARNPEAGEDIAAIAASVDTGIAETENAEGTLESALASSLTEEASEMHADEAEDALGALRERVLAGIASLENVDRVAVAGEIAEIENIVAEARTARLAGDPEAAFLLYMEADQRVTELDTLIEADQALDIGVLEEDSGTQE
jgi:hypothetical protein